MQSQNDDSNGVAIYWDFENIHACLTNTVHGADWYRNNKFCTQPALIDIEAILSYAASFGDIAINKAYGNWQWFGNYRHALNKAGIDLVQMFPRGQNSKNSADIRMALDALSDIHIHDHIDYVLIVSSDSDFISLAQKIKQAGKFVAGVGVENHTNGYFIAACNEFKFYHALTAQTLVERAPAQAQIAIEPRLPPEHTVSEDNAPDTAAPLSIDQARDALIKTLIHLGGRYDDNVIPNSSLKHAIKRLQPSFDEKLLGFPSFTAFIKRFPDIVTIVDHLSGGHVAPTVDTTEPSGEPG